MEQSPLTCTITGASSGIGRATALALARRGHRLILVCRPSRHAQAAVAAVAQAAAIPPTVVWADLATLAAARKAAADILAACERLDVVIHNAGVWPMRRKLTADGFETAFAVNHLAPFVMNPLLLPRLAQSDGRLVQVTAGLYGKGRVDLQNTPTGADFHRLRTYANTKLWNLLSTFQLARTLADRVSVNAVHPGVVRTRLGASKAVIGALLWLVKLTWMSPDKGALGPVFLATRDARSSGQIYDQCAVMKPLPILGDHTLMEKVVAETARLVAAS